MNELALVGSLISLLGLSAQAAAPKEHVVERDRARDGVVRDQRGEIRFSDVEIERIGGERRPIERQLLSDVRESGNGRLVDGVDGLREPGIAKDAAVAFSKMSESIAPTKNKSNDRIVTKMWQPEIDAVISTGSLEVEAFEARTSKDLETELTRENESQLKKQIAADDRVTKVLKMKTDVSKYGASVDKALRAAINAVNDYAPRNTGPAKVTINRLRATIDRLGMSDVLCIVTKAEAAGKVEEGEKPDARQFWQFLIVDKTTGQGFRILAVQGSM